MEKESGSVLIIQSMCVTREVERTPGGNANSTEKRNHGASALDDRDPPSNLHRMKVLRLQPHDNMPFFLLQINDSETSAAPNPVSF